jgi:hypothetical protein
MHSSLIHFHIANDKKKIKRQTIFKYFFFLNSKHALIYNTIEKKILACCREYKRISLK